MGLPPPEIQVTRWWTHQPPVDGYWGPSTSSIDWCEANYQITRFIAEFTNTLSTLVFVYWGLYGMKKCRDERLPLPIRLCQVGIIIIGIGSFLFHTTLQYGWQLADELPMIFGAAFSTYVIFDIGNPNLPRTRFVRSLPYLLSLYSFGVTAIYLRYRDPVFHQLAFGAIQLLSTSRSVYLIVTAPKETYREQKNKSDATRYILIGSATFLLGFLIWNVDNVLCDQISRLKEYLGTPLSFILEGHAWWHLATGTGSYLSGVGLQLLALSLKEGADGFEIKHAGILGLVPHIARTPINANAKLQ